MFWRSGILNVSRARSQQGARQHQPDIFFANEEEMLQRLPIVQTEAEKGALVFTRFAILGCCGLIGWWGINIHTLGSSPNG